MGDAWRTRAEVDSRDAGIDEQPHVGVARHSLHPALSTGLARRGVGNLGQWMVDGCLRAVGIDESLDPRRELMSPLIMCREIRDEAPQLRFQVAAESPFFSFCLDVLGIERDAHPA